MSTEISKDDQASLLDNQLRDLRTLRTNMKPSLAFLVGVLFLILGLLIIHGMFGILLAVLGVAGLLAGVAALAKRAGIDRQIEELQKQLEAL
jgi:VIT1/CCC1 family predicted Fe2+/Mn2+ transporter